MKKLLLSAVAVFAFTFANAQEVKFGAKAGANLSNVKTSFPAIAGESEANPDTKSVIGFHVGGFAEIKLSDKFAFQPELLLSTEGSKLETTDSGSIFGVSYSEKFESKVNLTYLNLPLLAKYYVTEDLFITAGPQLGFLLSAKSKDETSVTVGNNTETESSNENVKDDFKSINFSASVGAGYFFTENIFAEARYNVGLSNIAKSEDIDTGFGTVSYEPVAKVNTLQLSIGYKF